MKINCSNLLLWTNPPTSVLVIVILIDIIKKEGFSFGLINLMAFIIDYYNFGKKAVGLIIKGIFLSEIKIVNPRSNVPR